MKNILFSLILLFLAHSMPAKDVDGYLPLDKKNPVAFGGDYIRYQGKKIMLNERTFFVDGRLTKDITDKYPYAFSSFQAAVGQLKDGTPDAPMTIYLAPYVYWIDNPDDEAVRVPAGGGIPYGMEVKCNGLRLVGLTNKPQQVVLASNRGQTQGAVGNFTMFHFVGNDLSVENLTMGNYCNIDLVYPLMPKLNRTRRADAIVQAQLAICEGDRIMARRVHFVSRLNSCPLVGGKRVLFDDCYFECTDDALCGTGVHVNCKLKLFSSKPFYATQGTGAVFLNCDFEVVTRERQYLTKVGSAVTMVDCRLHTVQSPLYVGWTQDPTPDLKCYQYNVSLNEKPLFINRLKPANTVDMTGKRVLDAYRLVHKGLVVYNTYNLLRGADEWDPLKNRKTIEMIGKATGKKYTAVATMLTVSPRHSELESGVSTQLLQAQVLLFGNLPTNAETVYWSLSPEDAQIARLQIKEDGSCEVSGHNDNDEAKTILVNASTESGLQGTAAIRILPRYLEAPAFTNLPRIEWEEKGILAVRYELDLAGRADESLITWYRCTDAKGSNAIPVAVSRLNKPEQTYRLSPGDVGYYLMASVAPKHLRCHAGQTESVVCAQVIRTTDVPGRDFMTDFRNFPTNYQPKIIPGFWTVDGFKPADTAAFDWQPDTAGSWMYGSGVDGASGSWGLLQAAKGARLLYTPVPDKCAGMVVSLQIDPCKTAGQGFGSATGQYLDLYIQFDTRTLTGYGLRIVRTTKYDKAVEFILMKFVDGVATPLAEPVASSCYRSTCSIRLAMEGNKLTAHAESNARTADVTDHRILPIVDVSAVVEPLSFAGMGIQHTGSVGASASLLKEMKVEWK